VQSPFDGRVEWILQAEEGAEGPPSVQAGEPVIKLVGYDRLARQIEATEKKLTGYQDRLDRAQAAANKGEMERAQDRVQKTQAALEELGSKLAALVIAAPKQGVFTTELKRGAKLTSGEVVGKIAGEAVLSATFEVEDASPWSAGADVELKNHAKPDESITCKVLSAEGKAVAVECVGTLEAGATVILP